MEKKRILAQKAQVAVRLTEAGFVRPLLRARLERCDRSVGTHPTAVIEAQINRRSSTQEPLEGRLTLYCRLQHEVGLSTEEKTQARTTAFNHLVAMLRDIHPPVLPVGSDNGLNRYTPRLLGEIEAAYSANPRPSAELIQGLGRFLGAQAVR